MSDIAHAFAAAIALLGSLDPELIGIVVCRCASACRDRNRHGDRRATGGRPGGEPLSGRHLVIVLANALLGLPPVVVGLIVYMLLTRAGPLGFAGCCSAPPP